MPDIIHLCETDSTNTYLKSLVKEGLVEHGVAVYADYQTQGRGQQGNVWVSDRGQNLTCSYYFVLNIESKHHFQINMWISILVYNVLEDLGIKNVSVKWPNDIYVGDHKICGILIETTLQGHKIKDAIVGIGLNVNQRVFPNLAKATSLSLETQQTYDLRYLLGVIQSKALEFKFDDLSRQKDRYQKLLYKRGVAHVFKTPNGDAFSGTILGVDDFGALVVDISGSQKTFILKEIIF